MAFLGCKYFNDYQLQTLPSGLIIFIANGGATSIKGASNLADGI